MLNKIYICIEHRDLGSVKRQSHYVMFFSKIVNIWKIQI